MPLVTAYLGLGANLGDRQANLRAATALLESVGRCRVIARSSIYETRPVGITDQPDFLNAVVAVETSLCPEALLELCLSVEKRLGRQRTIRWGPRVIDIDILLYDGIQVRTDNLIVPHPELAKRAFVLVPLAEIAPEAEVALGLSARDAAAEIDCEGVSRVAGIS